MHSAACDGPGQVGLQGHLARHLDARQKAIVAAGLADFLQPLRDVPPERDFVSALMQQPRQGGAPRARAQDGDLHAVAFGASDGAGFFAPIRFSVPFISRLMLALCL